MLCQNRVFIVNIKRKRIIYNCCDKKIKYLSRYLLFNMDSLKEMSQFLDLTSRIDLKDVALQYIRGLSGNKEGISLIVDCEEVLKKIVLLTEDSGDLVRKEALLCLINISAEENGAVAIMKLNNILIESSCTLVKHLTDLLLDSQNKYADAACMALCNLTRPEQNLEKCVLDIFERLPAILDAFTNISHNKSGSNLHYLGPLLSNLSGSFQVREWLCNGETSRGGAVRVASFSHYRESIVRRGGAVGTLRNISFDVTRHNWLLGPKVDLLPYLLLPLVGGEEYPDDEMDVLPPSLQYLPPDKEREIDPDIRILLLEALSRLCVKQDGREFLRKHGTYYVLRELHKWETDRKSLLACENVVDILIRKEEEMGTEDITAVDVPAEYHGKFQKMDDDFINDV